MTMVLALIAITSAFRPFFLKKPFWSATQIGVLEGVLPAQAIRMRSCAEAELRVDSKTTAKIANPKNLCMILSSFRGHVAIAKFTCHSDRSEESRTIDTVQKTNSFGES